MTLLEPNVAAAASQDALAQDALADPAAFKRATDWKVLGRGRRLHDLRHTAICLWLARGVEPLTVKTWAGHESIGTTNGYVHYLGTSADDAGRVRLNAPRANLGQISREATA